MKKWNRRLLQLALVVAAFALMWTFGLHTEASAATSGDYTYTVTDGEATITGYSGIALELTIPSKIDGYPVTAIGDNAFKNNSTITKLMIPEGITSVGSYAFYNCDIQYVSFPKSITYLGHNAFWMVPVINISDLSAWCNVEMGGWYKWYGGMFVNTLMLVNGESLTDLVIPSDVTNVGKLVFNGMSNIRNIIIPDNVTIGDYAFANCTGLETVIIGSGVKIPLDTAGWFAGCKNLKTVVSASDLYDYELENCKSLKTVILREGVTKIGYRALDSFDGTLVLPKSLQNISDLYFSGDGVFGVFYRGSREDRVKITGYGMNQLLGLEWHYEVEDASMQSRNYFYCPECDRYFLEDGRPCYAITFQNWDGTELSTEYYAMGELVALPQYPSRPADEQYNYRFVGWDQLVTDCRGEAIYTAVYQQEERQQTAVTYTVTFMNFDGTNFSVLSSKSYLLGETLVVPADPARPADKSGSYVFTGWGGDVSTCTGDMVFIAQYRKVVTTYTVTFQDWNGTVLSADTYTYGEIVIPPQNPTRAPEGLLGYRFAGWDRTLTPCAGNVTYTATYTVDSLYVKIYKDGKEVSEQETLATGMEMMLMNGDEIIDRSTVVVAGDVNGDGKISVTDMLAVKSQLLKKSELEGAYAEAADVTADSKISITDFLQFKNHLLGKEQIGEPQAEKVSQEPAQAAEPIEPVELPTKEIAAPVSKEEVL